MYGIRQVYLELAGPQANVHVTLYVRVASEADAKAMPCICRQYDVNNICAWMLISAYICMISPVTIKFMRMPLMAYCSRHSKQQAQARGPGPT